MRDKVLITDNAHRYIQILYVMVHTLAIKNLML